VLLNSNADLINSSNSNLPSLEVIRQQPECLDQTLKEWKVFESVEDNLWSYLRSTRYQSLELVASGHSYYAALMGQYLLEQLAGVKTEVCYSSEYGDAPPPTWSEGLTLTLGVNLSDTDTQRIVESQASQPGDSSRRMMIPIEEKSFLMQVILYYRLTLHFVEKYRTRSQSKQKLLWQELQQVPGLMREAMESQLDAAQGLTKTLQGQSVGVILGRGLHYPLALEGARLLQQTGFHALGYAGGEFHHGPKAVVSEGLPIIAISPRGDADAPPKSKVSPPILKNALDMQSLGARIYGITTESQKQHFEQIIPIPNVSEWQAPFLNFLALQLLATLRAG
jgi:glucosamine--fructose-6-phosphate aminotransferase (isomerizing)